MFFKNIISMIKCAEAWKVWWIEVEKYRGPLRPNDPYNFVWTASQISLVN